MIIWILGILFGLIVFRPGMAADRFHIDEEVLKKAEERFGRAAPARLISWENLIRQGQGNSDLEKLEKVNSFFNRSLSYVDDIQIWGVNDYWATPIEFISLGAGDCEDYAIAKYFTLKAMGVSESKLNIAYVKALEINKPHMVLSYYSKPAEEPLILDNLIHAIKPSSQRSDLVPIFSFNGSGLWMAQQRGRGDMTASSRLRKWRELLTRISEEKF
ncbi:transglutaminase-like cysteine peptidase [Syntrophus gentianae]|uniref:transglutaminase-like cysteine peptidase n=1 Tax=Syntrophus gentianae TaxID=43775 RepID=UPI001C31C246|nr:transglutaminase-like cysteine peptidase [Syntrophus gentianae]